MKITESAVLAVLDTMKQHDLNPQNTSLILEVNKKGVFSISFSENLTGNEIDLHGLKVLISKTIDKENLIIDFCESPNKQKGLLFREDKNVN